MPEVFSFASGEELQTEWCWSASFFLGASRLAFAASPLNSVAPNVKKTSGTQGKQNEMERNEMERNVMKIFSLRNENL